MESSHASRVSLAIFEYDFAVDGGAAGAIVIGAGRLPAGAIISDGMILIITAIVGDTSTLAIHVTGAGDVLAATAEASLTVGLLVDTVCVNTAATAIEVGAAPKGCTFTIASGDLTAGKVRVGLRYMDLS